jgi:hypothetical protein
MVPGKELDFADGAGRLIEQQHGAKPWRRSDHGLDYKIPGLVAKSRVLARPAGSSRIGLAASIELHPFSAMCRRVQAGVTQVLNRRAEERGSEPRRFILWKVSQHGVKTWNGEDFCYRWF